MQEKSDFEKHSGSAFINNALQNINIKGYNYQRLSRNIFSDDVIRLEFVLKHKNMTFAEYINYSLNSQGVPSYDDFMRHNS